MALVERAMHNIGRDAAKDVCWDVIPNGPIYNSGRHLSYIGGDLVSSSIVDAINRLDALE